MTPAPQYPATIAAPVEHELVIKKSRFIAYLRPVASVADAEAEIARVRKQHWDARHNCTAMVTGVLGDQARSSDDGEPSGTAGVPMLEVLRRRAVTDLVAIVTRYFGGVKLGAGGLIRAYGAAVSEALDAARLVHRRRLTRATTEVSAAEAGRAEHVLRAWAEARGAVLDPPVYGTHARFDLWIGDDDGEALTADLAAASAGAWLPIFGESRITDVPC